MGKSLRGQHLVYRYGKNAIAKGQTTKASTGLVTQGRDWKRAQPLRIFDR